MIGRAGFYPKDCLDISTRTGIDRKNEERRPRALWRKPRPASRRSKMDPTTSSPEAIRVIRTKLEAERHMHPRRSGYGLIESSAIIAMLEDILSGLGAAE